MSTVEDLHLEMGMEAVAAKLHRLTVELADARGAEQAARSALALVPLDGASPEIRAQVEAVLAAPLGTYVAGVPELAAPTFNPLGLTDLQAKAAFVMGWNHCRDAMLAAAPQPGYCSGSTRLCECRCQGQILDGCDFAEPAQQPERAAAEVTDYSGIVSDSIHHTGMCRSYSAKLFNLPADEVSLVEAGNRLLRAAQLLDLLVLALQQPERTAEAVDYGRRQFQMYAQSQGLKDFEENEFGDYRNPFIRQPWNFWVASRDALAPQGADAMAELSPAQKAFWAGYEACVLQDGGEQGNIRSRWNQYRAAIAQQAAKEGE